MKIGPSLAVVALGVLAQVALARYAVGGRWMFDLVLVATVYAAVYWGPTGAMLAGAGGGLVQDLLSGGIVGVGGLGKTIVGFAAGLASGQLIVARAPARMALVAGATILYQFIVAALFAVIDQRWSGPSWGAMLGETGLNALAGWLAFQATEGLPGALQRRRAGRRTGLRRREW